MKKRYRLKETTLSNGLRVVAVETPHLSTAYAALQIGVGSRHERPLDNGLTHFLEHMVFRGTAGYKDARDLNAAAESIGGTLDAATYRDRTMYGTVSHPKGLPLALELLSEIVMRPRFRHMDTEREIVREEMRESFGARGQMVDVDTIAHAMIYAGHPLSQSIEGPMANLDRFGVPDLKRHLRTFYTAANTVLVIAGQCSLDALLPDVKKRFSQLPSGRAPATPQPQPRAPGPQFKWVNDTGSQVDLRVSFEAFSARDKDYPALSALSRVLGDGLSSRLHSELIDRMGLAYSLSAGAELFADCGSFDFDVTVAPAKVQKLLTELLRFADAACKKAPTTKELAQIKERYAIEMDFMSDAPADLGLWVGRGLLDKTDKDVDAAARAFMAVTPEDCLRAARRVFNRKTVAVVGVGQVDPSLRKALATAVAA